MMEPVLSAPMDSPPAALTTLPTMYPASPPLEEVIDRFWEMDSEVEMMDICATPPEVPLALLEQLGPSPFERGGFPLIGFLATTYDKVSRYALERA